MSSTAEQRRDLPAPGIANVCQKPYDGKIKENVSSYCDHFAQSGEHEEDFDYESRNEKAGDIATSYYTLVTDFYEYGYGPCFHFAPVPDGKSYNDCISDYEHEIASTLNARPGMKILVSFHNMPGWIVHVCVHWISINTVNTRLSM